MRPTAIVAAALGCSAAALGCSAAALAETADNGQDPWSYAGETGPERWSEIDHAYAACRAGRAQSPIDLEGPAAPAHAPEFHWNHVALERERDNGHTVQVTTEHAGWIDLDGARYDLAQFHFHHPSEHAIEGERHPLEVHFVHVSATGRLAVIGVMLDEGPENAALAPLWRAFTAAHDHDVAGVVTLDALLPEDHSAWRYDGSLTTPPCSEGVSWVVMRTPLQASAEQIEAFAALYRDNARPLQERNGRALGASD